MPEFKDNIIGCLEKYGDYIEAKKWFINAKTELNDSDFSKLVDDVLNKFFDKNIESASFAGRIQEEFCEEFTGWQKRRVDGLIERVILLLKQFDFQGAKNFYIENEKIIPADKYFLLESQYNDIFREIESKKRNEELMRTQKEEALRSLKLLGRKYCIETENILDTPALKNILKKIENGEDISTGDYDWLKANGHLTREIQLAYYRQVANNYYRDFQENGDIWNLIKACSNYRNARLPEIAIEVASKCPKMTSGKAMAAIMTTKGGAYRDLRQLLQARECANEAILISSTYHPYTLLGAICFDEKEFEEGDYCFKKAIELGAKSSDIDAGSRKILKARFTQRPEEYDWLADFMIF